VSLEIFNVIGQRVRVLAQADEPAGFRWREWDGMGDNGELRASGVYFVSLVARGNNGILFTAVQRILMLR
jgi:flagellar hook assembly protein FlgD